MRGSCLATVTIAVALAIGGCGDDDGSGDITVETSSLTKAQFIKQADAICRDSIEKMRLAGGAFLRTVEGSDTPYTTEKEEAPKLVDTVLVPEYEKQIEEVSSLGAPSGDQKKVAAVLEAISEALDDMEAEPIKFINNADALAKSERLANAYGFTACGGI